MPYPVKKPLVLYRIVLVLQVLKLCDRFHAGHCPVRQLPSFRPPDVHVFGADDCHDDLKVVVHHRSAQARSCVRGDSRLYAIDASLAQHQVRVVPLVGLFIAVCVLLNHIEFGPHYLFENWNFHADGRQLGNVECACLVIDIRQPMGTVVLSILKPQPVSALIHFFHEKHNLWIVLKMGRPAHVR